MLIGGVLLYEISSGKVKYITFKTFNHWHFRSMHENIINTTYTLIFQWMYLILKKVQMLQEITDDILLTSRSNIYRLLV